ncbi:hypothetical protein KR067_003069 [Drosophila pandora]|nr:hypothetical protein KR067_003069 [Drosophila pandora]
MKSECFFILEILGTSPTDIAARLSNRYPNLNASSPRGVTYRPKEPNFFARTPSTEMGKKYESDLNNNLATRVDMNLAANQSEELNSEVMGRKRCICMRPSIAYECGRCHQLFHGRLAEICEKHPSEAFLMDFQQCPYCVAPISLIKPSNLSWEQICKFEEAPLPADDDL